MIISKMKPSKKILKMAVVASIYMVVYNIYIIDRSNLTGGYNYFTKQRIYLN